MSEKEFDEAKKVWLRILIKDWYTLSCVQPSVEKINVYLDTIDIHNTTDSDIAVGFAQFLDV